MTPADPTQTPSPAQDQARAGRRAVVAASVGNAFEWYDFTVYALFAIYIGKAFFPHKDPTAELISAFVTFGVGYLVRPLGAILLGLYGDWKGRKAVLTATIALMLVGVAIIAFAPAYAAIGIGAQLLLLSARVLQGFSAGGEIGGAASLLIEHAPHHRRGEYVSWVQSTMSVSNIMGALVAVTVTSLLTKAQMESFGWRVPFIVGLLIGPIGLWIRRTLEESPEFERELAARKGQKSYPLKTLLATYPMTMLKGATMCIFWTVSSYALVIFMPTYVQKSLGYGPTDAFISSLISNALLAAVCVLAGIASDRSSRRAVLIFAMAWLVVLGLPMLWWMQNSHSLLVLTLAQCVLCVGVGCSVGVAPSALAEMFPAAVRATGVSICYNLAVTIFSGFAPAILTWIGSQGLAYAPAWYVMLAAALAAPSILSLKPNGGFASGPMIQPIPSEA